MLVSKRSPEGGLCFVLALLVIGGVWGLYFMQYIYANVGVVVALEQRTSMLPELPWAAPNPSPGGALAPPLAPGVNLQLRLFGQAELGCGAPLLLDYAGVPTVEGLAWSRDAPWLLQPQLHALPWQQGAAACGGTPNASLLTLSCPRCELHPDSYIRIALNFTCQSFLLEVVSVDAEGNLRALALDKRYSAANERNLLASVDWYLQPTLSWLEVTTAPLSSAPEGLASARGYAVAAASAASTIVNPATDLPDGGLQPLGNALVVTVHLPLQPTLYHTTIYPIHTPIDMISLTSSALGFLGVFGGWLVLVRLLREANRNRKEQGQRCCCGGGGGGRAAPIQADPPPPQRPAQGRSTRCTPLRPRPAQRRPPPAPTATAAAGRRPRRCGASTPPARPPAPQSGCGGGSPAGRRRAWAR